MHLPTAVTLLILKTAIFVVSVYLFIYFHISHLGTYYGNEKRHIQYTSSDNLHMV